MRTVRTSFHFVAISVLLLSAALTSWAGVTALPPALYGGKVYVYALGNSSASSIPVTGPGVFIQTQGDPYGGYATSTMALSAGPAPSLSLSTSISSVCCNASGGASNSYSAFGGLGPIAFFGDNLQGIVYSLEINGPTATVPIIVNSTVRASLGPNPNIIPGDDQLSEATFAILHGEVYPGNPTYGFLDFGSNVYLNGGGGPGFNQTILVNGGHAVFTNIPLTPKTGMSGVVSGPQVWLAHTGVVYSVQLGVMEAISIYGTLGQYGTITANESVDPTFQIDPTVSNANAYSISVSNGIGNSATPEPATLSLLATGLAGLGFARRRRKS